MLVQTFALLVACCGVAVVVWLGLLVVVCSWEPAAVVMLLSSPVAGPGTWSGHSGLFYLFTLGSVGCQC
jgi:hypothetical protein